MLRGSLLCAFVVHALAANASTGNNDVIILVHGFFGWGPDEMFGFNYWGGFFNIANELQAAGHDVRVGVCGPVSSNWDRAAELYAYIKGGQVDYGAAHAAKFNHSRYGTRIYPGIYPEWGTVRPDGSVRRVHLIGHSMGGQTIRILLRFLADGDANERQQIGASSLFQGGKVSWVHSISTLNTPHDGTTSVNESLGPFVTTVAWPFFKGICAINGLFSDDLLYDFKLGQFGLERRPGEGFLAYSDRVEKASMWEPGFKDFSSYDLGNTATREMNEITPAHPSVYYFSYATVDTRKTVNPFSKCQVPQLFMWAFLQPLAYLMGCTGDDDSWWPNDGVVNTISQTGPKVGSNDVILPWQNPDRVLPGIWNYMGARDGVDHVEIIGIGLNRVESYFKAIAATVASLPQQTTNVDNSVSSGLFV